MLSQRDPRWANVLLGNSRTSTIGAYGCLLTAMTMVAGWDDVARMNDCRTRTGGFQAEPYGAFAANFDLSACEPRAKLIRVSAKWTGPVPIAPLAELIAHLRSGNPAIIEVDMSVAPGQQQHFVTAVGVDDSGHILIHDPWPITPALERLDKYGGDYAKAIWRFILYEVPSDPKGAR
jgi:hypothetical protein